MAIRIKHDKHGLLLVNTDRPMGRSRIDAATIDGIVKATVNGRDIEDGIAPIEILASIAEAKLQVQDRELTMPDLPPWIAEPRDAGWTTIIQDLGITPLVAALARLAAFGGEDDEVTLA